MTYIWYLPKNVNFIFILYFLEVLRLNNQPYVKPNHNNIKEDIVLYHSKTRPRVGISGTTAKSGQRKFVPSSHTGPFALVASPGKSKTKVGTLACLDFL